MVPSLSPQEQQASQVSTFWQEKMGQHPMVFGILSTVGVVADFFLNGHFIKAAGRWVIQVGGYVAETVLMFAVLWITCSSVAPKLLLLFMSEQLLQYLVWLSLATLALIPEIILASAIVNAACHWLAVLRNRRNVGAWCWAILFTIPTLLFFILTALTLNTLGANGGNLVQASTSTLNLRLDAGWIYGLLELTYAGVKRFLPQAGIFSQPTPVPPVLPTPDELAQQLIPLLVPLFETMRQSILAEVQRSVPVPRINHQELAQSLVPLLPVPQMNHQELVRSLVPLLPIPSVERVDPEAIARAVAPLLRPVFVEARRTIIEEVKSIVPQMTAQQTPSQIEASTSTNDDSELGRSARLERAYQSLLREGKKPSANVLYVMANCNRKAAQQWLRVRQNGTGDISPELAPAITVPRVVPLIGTDQEYRSHSDTQADPPSSISWRDRTSSA